MLAQCPAFNQRVVKSSAHQKKKNKKNPSQEMNNQQNQTQRILKDSDSNVEGFHGEDGQQA